MDLLRKKETKNEHKANPILLKQLKDQTIEIFKIFDFYGINNIQIESVGHVFRMLGCVPLEKDIIEFVGLCEHPTEKGKIRFDDFFKIFFAWLLDERMKPANEDELLNCLKIIDAGEGVTANRLKQVASEHGESMDEEQMKTMLAIAIDKRTDKVIYDEFAFKLFQKPSIYELAKEIMKPVEPLESTVPPKTDDVAK